MLNEDEDKDETAQQTGTFLFSVEIKKLYE